jgi:hypothetical protein
MNTRVFVLTIGVVVMLAVSSPRAGQHEAQQTVPGGAHAAAQVVQCKNAQPGVSAVIDAALKRLDEARQSNSAAVMRAAADDLQSALLDVRTQLAPCAEIQLAAGDPHAGHAMPNVQQAPAAASGTAVIQPGSTTASPAAVAPAAPAPGGVDPRAPVRPAAPPAATAQGGSSSQAQQRSEARQTNTPDITFRTIPSPPRGAADNEFEVTVKDSEGKPIEGADVSLLFYMPAVPSTKMPEMRNEVKLQATGGGKYTGKGQVMMAGAWTVTVSVRQNGGEIGQRKVTVTAK